MLICASANHVGHVVPGMLENPEPTLNELLEVVRRAILEAAELKNLAERLAKAREIISQQQPLVASSVKELNEGGSDCFFVQTEPVSAKEHRR